MMCMICSRFYNLIFIVDQNIVYYAHHLIINGLNEILQSTRRCQALNGLLDTPTYRGGGSFYRVQKGYD